MPMNTLSLGSGSFARENIVWGGGVSVRGGCIDCQSFVGADFGHSSGRGEPQYIIKNINLRSVRSWNTEDVALSGLRQGGVVWRLGQL
jgi:hypothetical protein